MRRTAILLLLTLGFAAFDGVAAQELSDAAKEKMKNPLFTSSLEFLAGNSVAPVAVLA